MDRRTGTEAPAVWKGAASRYDLEITRLEALGRAGETQCVAERLERFAGEVADDDARIDLFTRLARSYADLGRHAHARRALASARAVAARSSGERDRLALLACEVALAVAADEFATLPATLGRLAAVAPGEALDPNARAARAAYAEALLDAIESYVPFGETEAAAAALAQVDRVLAPEESVAPALRARHLRLRAELHFCGVTSVNAARAEGLEAYRLARESGDVRLTWRALFLLVEHNLGTLDERSVRYYSDVLLEQARALGNPRLLVRATILVVQSDLQHHDFAAALERIEDCRPRGASAHRALCDLAAAHALQSSAKPRSALERLGSASAVGHAQRLPFLCGIVELVRARAHGALGNGALAAAAAHNALARFESDRFPHYLEACYRQLFALTGLVEYHERATDIARSFREAAEPDVSPLPPQPRANGRIEAGVLENRGAVLTRRQREVALLVHQGLTNRAIASALGISERTVAHHVEAILGRLGLRTRWQISTENAG
jgi:DNA-binding CsgD family transcriptional regulator